MTPLRDKPQKERTAHKMDLAHTPRATTLLSTMTPRVERACFESPKFRQHLALLNSDSRGSAKRLVEGTAYSQTSSSSRKVTIVGAGYAGLFALKHCLEAGLDATIFEASSYIGGVWDSRSKAMLETTECVSSKHYMGASDFPMDDSYPEFPLQHDVLRYLHSYAEKFNLHSHIRTNSPVKAITQARGTWMTLLQNGDQVESGFVILCTGVFHSPSMPEEWKKLTTTVIHGGDYVRVRDTVAGSSLANKRILIVGNSDTACDVASDLFMRGARSMYMASRKGAWFQDKSTGYGKPADMFYSFFLDAIKRTLGRTLFEKWVLRALFLPYITNIWGEHGLGLDAWKPAGNYLASAYVKSRKIISFLNNGSVTPITSAEPVSGNKVAFRDKHGHDCSKDFDLVVVCSGYKFNPVSSMQLQDNGWLQDLYKMSFSNSEPSLAVVGNVRPYVTSIVAMAEFQAWRVAHAFANGEMPDKQTREAQIKQDEAAHAAQFPTEHERLPCLVDPYDFTREVAHEVGADKWWRAMPWLKRAYMTWVITTMSWSHAVYRLHADHDGSIERHLLETYHYHKASLGIRDTVTQKLSMAAAIGGGGVAVLLLRRFWK